VVNWIRDKRSRVITRAIFSLDLAILQLENTFVNLEPMINKDIIAMCCSSDHVLIGSNSHSEFIR